MFQTWDIRPLLGAVCHVRPVANLLYSSLAIANRKDGNHKVISVFPTRNMMKYFSENSKPQIKT